MAENEDANEDSWVEIRRFGDTQRAQHAEAFLREHGVRVHRRGNGGYVSSDRSEPLNDVRLLVPESELEEANEALDELDAEEDVPAPPRSH